MSAKRRLQRSVLRATTPDEATFRATLGVVEHVRRLGFEQVAVGFFPKSETSEKLVPNVVVHGKGTGDETKAFTYRLDNYELRGTREQCEKRWREWVISLVGQHRDIPKETLDGICDKSVFARPEARTRLVQAFEAAGLVIPFRAPSPRAVGPRGTDY